MSREVKFRAWDIKDKFMLSWVVLVMQFNLKNVLFRPEQCGLVLMQYTGLKDKNGVEIYEGDIVRWHDVVTNDYTVTFIDGVFCIDEMPSSNFYHLSDDIGTKWEVVGNIYENTVLMEDE